MHSNPLQWRVIPGPSAREKRESIIQGFIWGWFPPRAQSTRLYSSKLYALVFRFFVQRDAGTELFLL